VLRDLRSRFSSVRKISRFHTARVINGLRVASELGPLIPRQRTCCDYFSMSGFVLEPDSNSYSITSSARVSVLSRCILVIDYPDGRCPIIRRALSRWASGRQRFAYEGVARSNRSIAVLGSIY